jgi:hypothetical protein
MGISIKSLYLGYNNILNLLDFSDLGFFPCHFYLENTRLYNKGVHKKTKEAPGGDHGTSTQGRERWTIAHAFICP